MTYIDAPRYDRDWRGNEQPDPIQPIDPCDLAVKDLFMGEDEPPVQATPFTWPDPAAIVPRRWLFGRWLLRGEITALVSPGGLGKSTFTTAMALSLASGRELLGKTPWEGACRVWLWNLEDDRDELARQVTACSVRHGVGAAECEGRLFVNSGVGRRLCTATEGPDGVKIIEPRFDEMKAEIERRALDVLIVDPFVASHEVDENSNGAIEAVAARWKRLASETGTSIVLVHHTKKMAGQAVTAEASRGAVAFTNKARSTLVMNPMTAEEAEKWGVDTLARRSLVRVDDDKPNRAPAEKAWWMQKESVALGNVDEFDRTDEVGVAVPWTPPNPLDGLSAGHLYLVQKAIDGGRWGDNVQSKDWAGQAVANVIEVDLDDSASKGRVKALLATWKANGVLKVERQKDENSRERPFVVVGRRVEPSPIHTSQSVVGIGVESGDDDHSEHVHTTPPIGGWGCGGVEPHHTSQEAGE